MHPCFLKINRTAFSLLSTLKNAIRGYLRFKESNDQIRLQAQHATQSISTKYPSALAMDTVNSGIFRG